MKLLAVPFAMVVAACTPIGHFRAPVPQPAVLAASGDSVRVRFFAGGELHGRLVRSEMQTVVLRVGLVDTTLARPDFSRVDRWRRRNATLVILGDAVFGVVAAYGYRGGRTERDVWFGAAVGAGLGAADLATRPGTWDTVYESYWRGPAAGSSASGRTDGTERRGEHRLRR